MEYQADSPQGTDLHTKARKRPEQTSTVESPNIQARIPNYSTKIKILTLSMRNARLNQPKISLVIMNPHFSSIDIITTLIKSQQDPYRHNPEKHELPNSNTNQ